MEINYYRFCGHIYGEKVAGLVKAYSLDDAKERLRSTYDDFDEWDNCDITKTEFFKNGVCEVYYGC